MIRLSLWGIEIYQRRKLLSCEKRLRILTSLLYTVHKVEEPRPEWCSGYALTAVPIEKFSFLKI